MDRRQVKEQYTRMFTEITCVLHDEIASTVSDQKGNPDRANEIRLMVQRAYQEVKQGSAMTVPLQVVVGRKAAKLEYKTMEN